MVNRYSALILISIWMVVFTPNHAQTIDRYGVRLGLNLANIRGNDCFPRGTNPAMGGVVGGFAVIDLERAYDLRPELGIIQRGYMLKHLEPAYTDEGIKLDEDYEWIATVAIYYLNTTAMAVVHTRKQLQILFGGYLEYPLHITTWTSLIFPEGTGQEFKATAIKEAKDAEVHSTKGLTMDLGLTAGARRQFGRWEGSIRVSYGLLRAINKQRKFKHYGFQFEVGYIL